MFSEKIGLQQEISYVNATDPNLEQSFKRRNFRPNSYLAFFFATNWINTKNPSILSIIIAIISIQIMNTL